MFLERGLFFVGVGIKKNVDSKIWKKMKDWFLVNYLEKFEVVDGEDCVKKWILFYIGIFFCEIF